MRRSFLLGTLSLPWEAAKGLRGGERAHADSARPRGPGFLCSPCHQSSFPKTASSPGPSGASHCPSLCSRGALAATGLDCYFRCLQSGGAGGQGRRLVGIHPCEPKRGLQVTRRWGPVLSEERRPPPALSRTARSLVPAGGTCHAVNSGLGCPRGVHCLG